MRGDFSCTPHEAKISDKDALLTHRIKFLRNLGLATLKEIELMTEENPRDVKVELSPVRLGRRVRLRHWRGSFAVGLIAVRGRRDKGHVRDFC